MIERNRGQDVTDVSGPAGSGEANSQDTSEGDCEMTMAGFGSGDGNDAQDSYDPNLVKEFASRFNGTKTPPVDSAAIINHIWAGLGRRGMIDRHGRFIGKPIRK